MPVFDYSYPPPSSIPCPVCPNLFTDHSSWKKHIRSQHGADASYVCHICSSRYQAINGVSSHFVHCRKSLANFPPPPDCINPPTTVSSNPHNLFPCTVCVRSFNSKIGRSIHTKSAHPDIYNQLHEPLTAHKVWSDEETTILAKAEARVGTCSNINQVLHQLFPHRTFDSIKSKRKNQAYRSLVQSFLSNPSGSDDNSPSSAEEDIPSDSCDTSSDPTPVPDNASVSRAHSRATFLEFFSSLDPASIHDCTKPLLQLLVSQPDDLPSLLIEAENALHSLNPTGSSDSRNRRRRPRPIRNNLNRYRKGKRSKQATFRQFQRLFSKDKKRLVETILNPDQDTNVSPSSNDIEGTFCNLFSSPSPPDNHPYEPLQPKNTIMYPVHPSEVEACLTGLKGKAIGPDGINSTHFQTLNCNTWAFLFSVFLFCRDIPSSLKANRTTLIPKSGNLSHATNWRPITISSLILRVFHKILSKRLNSIVSLNSKQQAFTCDDGLMANSLLLQTLIKTARNKKKNLCIISIDLAKAFDSVSHSSIIRALKRQNLEQDFIDYISSSYSGCTTSISCKQSTTAKVCINRGVKQGDPLSPFLFNCVIDELCATLPDFIGFKLDQNNVNCLAFADDLLLVASSTQGAAHLLEFATNFFHNRNMKLNASKCKALNLIKLGKSKKIIYGSKPFCSINDTPLSLVNHVNLLRYLGIPFSPSGRLKPCFSTFDSTILKIRNAPLKPQQKVELLRSYVCPKFIHELSLSDCTKGSLLCFDKTLRRTIRHILYLPDYSPCDFFYLPRKLGGLGLPNFSELVPLSVINRINNLHSNPNGAIASLVSNSYVINLLNKMLGITNSQSKTEIIQSHADGLFSNCYGSGLEHCCQKPSVGWLSHYNGKGRNFIDCLKLRLNILPCKGAVASQSPEKGCRFGCARRETLSHISQGCPIVHQARLNRHNRLLDLVCKSIPRTNEVVVHREAHVRYINGLKKPDIITVTPDSIIVTDITVPWETPSPPEDSYNTKVRYYSEPDFLNELKSRWPNRDTIINAIVITARGGWCPLNDETCKALNIPNNFKHLAVIKTLENSVILYRQFMRTVQP